MRKLLAMHLPPLGPFPSLKEIDRPFWEGAATGRLMIQRCQECGSCRLPAARVCSCGGSRQGWEETSGRAELWAHCRFHKLYFNESKTLGPYRVIVVKLTEGPLLYSNLVGVDGVPPLGTPLRAVFDAVSGSATLVRFTPILGAP